LVGATDGAIDGAIVGVIVEIVIDFPPSHPLLAQKFCVLVNEVTVVALLVQYTLLLQSPFIPPAILRSLLKMGGESLWNHPVLQDSGQPPPSTPQQES
jgi:hypothetical protein